MELWIQLHFSDPQGKHDMQKFCWNSIHVILYEWALSCSEICIYNITCPLECTPAFNHFRKCSRTEMVSIQRGNDVTGPLFEVFFLTPSFPWLQLTSGPKGLVPWNLHFIRPADGLIPPSPSPPPPKLTLWNSLSSCSLQNFVHTDKVLGVLFR